MRTGEPVVDTDLARRGAERFLSDPVSLEGLGHGDSVAYRVRAAGQAYLLRLHVPARAPVTPGFFHPRAIESECLWLEALERDTDLVVPSPVMSGAGGYVVQLDPGGSESPVPCSLLTWVQGEHVAGPRSPEQACELGHLLARLHDHAEAWRLPEGFERPTHGPDSWWASLARLDELVTGGVASGSDRDLWARVVERAHQELTPLAAEPGRRGLIHADLHGDNYLFHAGRPRPLDFGRCGFGPWLVDLAECLPHLGPARRGDLLEAYGTSRPLEDGDLRRIEGYFLASLVEVFGHNAPDPAEADYLRRAIPAWSPHAQRYLAGDPFLLEL